MAQQPEGEELSPDGSEHRGEGAGLLPEARKVSGIRLSGRGQGLGGGFSLRVSRGTHPSRPHPTPAFTLPPSTCETQGQLEPPATLSAAQILPQSLASSRTGSQANKAGARGAVGPGKSVWRALEP